jgi:hypothetical protein
MTKPADGMSELVQAADALEHDMRRLEELSASVRKIRLHNEKSITRAARELQDALQQQEKLAQGLIQLGQAMARMQQRQEAAIEPLAARALEIQDRATRLDEQMHRFAELGARAGEASRLLQSLSQTETGTTADPGPVLADVDERLDAIVSEAKALVETAQADDLSDVAREADALKQRVQSTRARLSLLIKNHSQKLN